MTNDAPPETARQPVVLVTGPSGAGLSTAMNGLEDLWFESIDNVPISFLPRLLDGRPLDRPLALKLDTRNRDFGVEEVAEAIRTLRTLPAYAPSVLYLDCRSDVLLKRFSETRRRHPFSQDGAPAVGIRRERDLLAPLAAAADIVVDTSDMSPHDLRTLLAKHFDPHPESGLRISVESFSYKRGVPQDLDMVLDVRFLANPHWVEELRPLDGRDDAVAAHVAADPRFADFYDRAEGLIISLLPAYVDEGKTHFAIGFGCTGGRHRSVTLAEKTARALANGGWQVSIRHRELDVPDRMRPV